MSWLKSSDAELLSEGLSFADSMLPEGHSCGLTLERLQAKIEVGTSAVWHESGVWCVVRHGVRVTEVVAAPEVTDERAATVARLLGKPVRYREGEPECRGKNVRGLANAD